MRDTTATNSGCGGGVISVQGAVDAQPHLAAILEWLQVDIAGARAEGLLQNLVHQANDAAVAPRRRRLIQVQHLVPVASPPSPGAVVLVVFGPLEGLAPWPAPPTQARPTRNTAPR